ncbi:MAG TPA: DUF192 domain-containing protein [Candidatus Aphodovivens excrementavium]|nr:DUF192 domain-containing protein [Candidatus Aphodovivens excrementavium]
MGGSLRGKHALRVKNASLGASQVRFALNARQRAKGLFAHRGFSGVLVLAPCKDVHTMGMGEPIDIAFIDREGVVLESHRAVGPFRRLRNGKASFVLERFSRGQARWVAPGDRVMLSGSSRLQLSINGRPQRLEERNNYENVPHLPGKSIR